MESSKTPNPLDGKTPFFMILEFEEPVTEEQLKDLVQDASDFLTDNKIKNGHRATFDGFGRHVAVEPTSAPS